METTIVDMEQKSEQKQEQKNDASGLFIPAGLFIGMGLGFFFHNITVGIFGGLGIGFLLFALVKNMRK